MISIDNMKEYQKINSILDDPYNIIHIQNPSEELQLLAIKDNANCIKYIVNPTLNTQIAAVKSNPYSLVYIDNIHETVFKICKQEIIFWLLDCVFENSIRSATIVLDILIDYKIIWPEIIAIKSNPIVVQYIKLKQLINT